MITWSTLHPPCPCDCPAPAVVFWYRFNGGDWINGDLEGRLLANATTTNAVDIELRYEPDGVTRVLTYREVTLNAENTGFSSLGPVVRAVTSSGVVAVTLTQPGTDGEETFLVSGSGRLRALARGLVQQAALTRRGFPAFRSAGPAAVLYRHMTVAGGSYPGGEGSPPSEPREYSGAWVFSPHTEELTGLVDPTGTELKTLSEDLDGRHAPIRYPLSYPALLKRLGTVTTSETTCAMERRYFTPGGAARAETITLVLSDLYEPGEMQAEVEAQLARQAAAQAAAGDGPAALTAGLAHLHFRARDETRLARKTFTVLGIQVLGTSVELPGVATGLFLGPGGTMTATVRWRERTVLLNAVGLPGVVSTTLKAAGVTLGPVSEGLTSDQGRPADDPPLYEITIATAENTAVIIDQVAVDVDEVVCQPHFFLEPRLEGE